MKTSGAKRIAERYVKALFDVAKSASVLDAVEKDLGLLGHAFMESEDFRQFLTNPLLTCEVQEKVITAMLDKMKAHEVTKKFMATLVAQKRLAILPEITEIFAEWAQAVRGEIMAEVTVPAKLSAKETKLVGERLSKAYGKQVNMHMHEDPSLLGGMIVKIGSEQLDSSLSGKLNRLKIAFQTA